MLGGGGYSIRNVSRCWTNETAVLLDVDLPNDLPNNDYFAHFAPDYKLQNTGIDVENMNTRAYLDTLLTQVRKNIRTLQHAPSVQMKAIPPSLFDDVMEMVDEDAEDKDAGEDYLRESGKDGALDSSPFRPNPTAEFAQDSSSPRTMDSLIDTREINDQGKPSGSSSPKSSQGGDDASPRSSKGEKASSMEVDEDQEPDISKGCF